MIRTTILAAALATALTGTAHATMYTIPLDVSAGHMNIRTGPGTNYALIGAIPAGRTVSATRCVARQDGIRGADWCVVNWEGISGWVSKSGLMPAAASRPSINTTPVASSNIWRNNYSSDRQMCLMYTMKTDANDVVSDVALKWTPKSGLFVHVTKSSWSIESRTMVPMSVVFDTGVRTGSGIVLEDQSGGSTIQIDINEDQDGFMDDVANAKKLTITFNGGDEPSWVIPMAGSRDAAATFTNCIAKVRAVASPTQPGTVKLQNTNGGV